MRKIEDWMKKGAKVICEGKPAEIARMTTHTFEKPDGSKVTYVYDFYVKFQSALLASGPFETKHVERFTH